MDLNKRRTKAKKSFPLFVCLLDDDDVDDDDGDED